MDVSCRNGTGLALPMGLLFILSADGGMWKAEVRATCKEIIFQKCRKTKKQNPPNQKVQGQIGLEDVFFYVYAIKFWVENLPWPEKEFSFSFFSLPVETCIFNHQHQSQVSVFESHWKQHSWAAWMQCLV